MKNEKKPHWLYLHLFTVLKWLWLKQISVTIYIWTHFPVLLKCYYTSAVASVSQSLTWKSVTWFNSGGDSRNTCRSQLRQDVSWTKRTIFSFSARSAKIPTAATMWGDRLMSRQNEDACRGLHSGAPVLSRVKHRSEFRILLQDQPPQRSVWVCVSAYPRSSTTFSIIGRSRFFPSHTHTLSALSSSHHTHTHTLTTNKKEPWKSGAYWVKESDLDL